MTEKSSQPEAAGEFNGATEYAGLTREDEPDTYVADPRKAEAMARSERPHQEVMTQLNKKLEAADKLTGLGMEYTEGDYATAQEMVKQEGLADARSERVREVYERIARQKAERQAFMDRRDGSPVFAQVNRLDQLIAANEALLDKLTEAERSK